MVISEVTHRPGHQFRHSATLYSCYDGGYANQDGPHGVVEELLEHKTIFGFTLPTCVCVCVCACVCVEGGGGVMNGHRWFVNSREKKKKKVMQIARKRLDRKSVV